MKIQTTYCPRGHSTYLSCSYYAGSRTFYRRSGYPHLKRRLRDSIPNILPNPKESHSSNEKLRNLKKLKMNPLIFPPTMKKVPIKEPFLLIVHKIVVLCAFSDFSEKSCYHTKNHQFFLFFTLYYNRTVIGI